MHEEKMIYRLCVLRVSVFQLSYRCSSVPHRWLKIFFAILAIFAIFAFHSFPLSDPASSRTSRNTVTSGRHHSLTLCP